jgi:nucleoside-diphosphate-sugar epimerase
MITTIVVAGATGNLGGRIVGALVKRGANVCALLRPGTSTDRVKMLERDGVRIAKVDMLSVSELTRVCAGASCVVSALQGLRDVIVETQSVLLDAAIAAGVPRFIPSDYSIDFMKLPAGLNRNLDLRRTFHERLDVASIAATSILNGAFSDLLTSRMPLLGFEARRVSYWESADQRLDFTTMDDTASFTAAAALDATAPKVLRIAGDQISARELTTLAGELTRIPFELVRMGSLDDLAAIIQRERAADPASENSPYPRWQGMQYMRDMFSGGAKLDPIDNDRYPSIEWTTVRDVIARALNEHP